MNTLEPYATCIFNVLLTTVNYSTIIRLYVCICANEYNFLDNCWKYNTISISMKTRAKKPQVNESLSVVGCEGGSGGVFQ